VLAEEGEETELLPGLTAGEGAGTLRTLQPTAGGTLSTTLERLLALQDRDRRIMRLQQESLDIPARKQAVAAGIQEQKDAVHRAQDVLKKTQAAIKQLELETGSREEKIKKLREQQFQVKSNSDYKTLEKEIKAFQAEIRAFEDREIELMEEIERNNAFVAGKEGDLKKGEAQIRADMAEMDRRLAEIEGQIRDLQAERGQIAPDIAKDWLARYERVISHTRDYALVPVENGACGGCHMKLPPQAVHEARKALAITTCGYCSRMLYWQP
jgi:uncharacterized protein